MVGRVGNLTAIREQSKRREACSQVGDPAGENTVTSASVDKIVSIYHFHPDLDENFKTALEMVWLKFKLKICEK